MIVLIEANLTHRKSFDFELWLKRNEFFRLRWVNLSSWVGRVKVKVVNNDKFVGAT